MQTPLGGGRGEFAYTTGRHTGKMEMCYSEIINQNIDDTALSAFSSKCTKTFQEDATLCLALRWFFHLEDQMPQASGTNLNIAGIMVWPHQMSKF